MKILLIAYSFPPLNDAQSIRWYYLTKVLAKNGYKIDILTIKLPYNYKNDFYISKNIRIHRVFPGFFEYFSYKIKSSFGIYANRDAEVRQSLVFLTLKKLYWLFRNWIGGILPGGIRSEWFPFIYRYTNNLNINEYSAIITSQEPLIDSLIGLLLKKKYGSSIYWIADIGDPMFSAYYPRWKRYIDGYIEKMIIRYADKVIVTNRSIVDYLVKNYKAKKYKLKVITQGFCNNMIVDTNNQHYRKENKLKLFFAGSFYDGFREPYNLFKAVEKIDGVKLIIAGRNEKFLKGFKSDKIEFIGVVSHFEVLKKEIEADVLVNISNKHRYQVPGKLFEYLGARKPILNIVYDDNDETVNVIKKLNIGVVCKNEVFEIEKAIRFLLSLKKSYDKYFNFKNPLIDNFSWEKKAEQIAELLNEKNPD